MFNNTACMQHKVLICHFGNKTYNKGYYMCSNFTRPYKAPILISFLLELSFYVGDCTYTRKPG